MSKRVVRVISYEGNAEEVDRLLRESRLQPRRTLFSPKVTVKEIQRIELRDGERLLAPLKAERIT